MEAGDGEDERGMAGGKTKNLAVSTPETSFLDDPAEL